MPNSETSRRLQELAEELLQTRSLLLASNRGPVEFSLTPSGGLKAQRGSGGVVTALSAVSRYADLTWIAAPMSDGDRRAAQDAGWGRISSPLEGQRMALRFVDLPKAMYHRYYNVFCNPLLWFLQHYMWNSPLTPNVTDSVYEGWNDGYVPVNERFARAIIEEALAAGDERPPFVMLHDYHLYLVAGAVRAEVPGVVLQQFIHIPWPSPHYWKLLPAFMREAICQNLCANDIVGLQTVLDVRNFLTTVQTFIPDAEVDWDRYTVWHDGHLTRVQAYPISIDSDEVARLAGSDRVREYEAKLRPLCNDHTIVRVDRLEPSKNIVRGFRAYEALLERRPDLLGNVSMLAFLVPSRTSIRQYQRYAAEVLELIQSINQRFGSEDWQPVHLFHENNYAQAIAGMKLADVLLVNAVIDGMNLVAKEGSIVSERDAVLVLSDSVGAWDELGEWALGISPADIEGTFLALDQAVRMDAAERARRAAGLREQVQQNDIATWMVRQFQDLRELV